MRFHCSMSPVPSSSAFIAWYLTFDTITSILRRIASASISSEM
jgi:hypothetical protein